MPTPRIVLINPYELGRQPFALAHAAAWLDGAGYEVSCVDLSLERLEPSAFQNAGFIAISLPMHTATRIAFAALDKIQKLAPQAALCAFGLYAPMNREFLMRSGFDFVFGGECEEALVQAVRQVVDGSPPAVSEANSKPAFRLPLRRGLPPLQRYAHLVLPDGSTKVSGFAEGTRGCKHLCRHCPVVPVYQGRFRALPIDIVLADIEQQVQGGATHISFGDPDFLNGPGHALRIADQLHQRFPQLSYDATIKVEHIVRHPDIIARLGATGCVFITTAVESVDDRVLELLAKNHSTADFRRAVDIARQCQIALHPTFIPFSPWTTLESYRNLLDQIVALDLVENVAPVQLSIRLLVPHGSWLFRIDGFAERVQAFDPELLGYPWHHPDPRVDALQREIQAAVTAGEEAGLPRMNLFTRIWTLSHQALGLDTPLLSPTAQPAVPRMSEPWYCCAEPTSEQLVSF